MLLSAVCGIYNPYNFKKNFYQSLKPLRSAYDDRYVWFTRSLQDEVKNKVKSVRQYHRKKCLEAFCREGSVVKPKDLFQIQ